MPSRECQLNTPHAGFVIVERPFRVGGTRLSSFISLWLGSREGVGRESVHREVGKWGEVGMEWEVGRV